MIKINVVELPINNRDSGIDLKRKVMFNSAAYVGANRLRLRLPKQECDCGSHTIITIIAGMYADENRIVFNYCCDIFKNICKGFEKEPEDPYEYKSVTANSQEELNIILIDNIKEGWEIFLAQGMYSSYGFRGSGTGLNISKNEEQAFGKLLRKSSILTLMGELIGVVQYSYYDGGKIAYKPDNGTEVIIYKNDNGELYPSPNFSHNFQKLNHAKSTWDSLISSEFFLNSPPPSEKIKKSIEGHMKSYIEILTTIDAYPEDKFLELKNKVNKIIDDRRNKEDSIIAIVNESGYYSVKLEEGDYYIIFKSNKNENVSQEHTSIKAGKIEIVSQSF